PEQPAKSNGVIRRKLSRLTRTISTSSRRRQSRSRCRAVVTPPKPPPRITTRVFGGRPAPEPFVWDEAMPHLLGDRFATRPHRPASAARRRRPAAPGGGGK